MFRKTLRAVAIVIVMVATLVAFFVWTGFAAYQPAVGRVVRQVSESQPALSPAASQVFLKLDGPAVPWIVSKALLGELAPEPVRMSEWHVRGLVWQTLLPLHVTPPELLALYCHYMRFDGGQGVEYGSAKYYQKRPNQLTVEEAIGLVAISRYPRNSPDHDREAFNRSYERLRSRYFR